MGGERHDKVEKATAPAGRASKSASKPTAVAPADAAGSAADAARRLRAASIDPLMEQAEQALRAGRWFEAERLALRALSLARRRERWEAMARIVLPLQEARRLRLGRALDTRKVSILTDAMQDGADLAPGCYLVQPPLVGADARRIRLAAMRKETCVAILCREPLTRRKLVPLVAIGGATIRAYVAPPKDPQRPTLEWFVAGMEAIGDAAIASIDSGLDLDRQIDCVLACLDSIPDHEKLHQLLGEMCRRAAKGFERRLPPRLFGEDDEEEDELEGSTPPRSRGADEDE